MHADQQFYTVLAILCNSCFDHDVGTDLFRFAFPGESRKPAGKTEKVHQIYLKGDLRSTVMAQTNTVQYSPLLPAPFGNTRLIQVQYPQPHSDGLRGV